MLNPKLDPPCLSHERYLELEESSPIKHEYKAGQIFAMTGTSNTHTGFHG